MLLVTIRLKDFKSDNTYEFHRNLGKHYSDIILNTLSSYEWVIQHPRSSVVTQHTVSSQS